MSNLREMLERSQVSPTYNFIFASVHGGRGTSEHLFVFPLPSNSWSISKADNKEAGVQRLLVILPIHVSQDLTQCLAYNLSSYL